MPDYWRYLDNYERTLKALANRRRLAILAYLARRPEASVQDIADATRQGYKGTSNNLARLRAAYLVRTENKETYIYYRLAPNLPEYIRKIIEAIG